MTRPQRFTLLATIIGSAVVFLDGSVVNLALPHMAQEMGMTFAAQQWVVDGYLLTLSALMLLGGSLGDILGRKRVYMVGVAGFAVLSLLCAFVVDPWQLIAARLLQGVFGALMVPGALAIINTAFDGLARARAIARWTAATSAVIAVGPLAGGYIVDNGSWRWIFLLNVPLLLLCWLFAWRSLHESKPTRQKIDYAGAALATFALGGCSYGLIEGPAQQWALPTVVSLLAGVGLAAAFIWYERHNPAPMVDMRLFASRNFVGVNIATFALYGALGGFFFALVIYLQTVVGFSTMQAGLSALPVSLALVALSGRAGALASRYGPRLFMTAGPILVGMGILLLLPLGPGADYIRDVLPGLVVFGLGMAITVAPLTATMLGAVDPKESGIASAINNAVSRVAGLLVVALLGLYGAGVMYQFATVLCGGMAIGAGVASWVLIRNQQA